MFLRKTITKTLAALAACTLMSQAHAGLVGDTVGIQYVGQQTSSALQSVVVGSGEEGNFFGNQYFDFGDLGFSIRSIASYGGIFTSSSSQTVSLVLSDLDFGFSLANVLLSTNLTGVSTSFTDRSVTRWPSCRYSGRSEPLRPPQPWLAKAIVCSVARSTIGINWM